ncbi:transcription elongation factor GreA [Candidatus Acetothermia bacterium]|jgi:transcription elongation factor GreA|nr:transcription elongation factor GreA [Candidatus Acetothermia bacterium]MCI2432683.1 transcription elongation factor GreA [Candidatus Acetothermia bacterium]MCI2436071.1 transcription elongation factor GreA [Candidatus Acetothermia bacterium]
MPDRIPMTPEGYQQIKTELERLTAERPKIAEMIARARAYGDLSENAEYHSAKEKQALVEAKIRDLEYKLTHAFVVTHDAATFQSAALGCWITLQDVQTGSSFKYKLVGPAEADPEHDMISAAAPVGKALLGCTVGQTVEVHTPSGPRRYKITHLE